MQRKCAAEKWFYPSVRKLFISEVLVGKMILFFFFVVLALNLFEETLQLPPWLD